MNSIRTPPASRPVWLVLLAGCLIALIGFGVRSGLGLFLEPATTARGWSREEFGLALAVQNLLWGLCLPLAGALADKFGARWVISAGAVVYALGLWGMSVVEAPGALVLIGGVLSGVGVAFTAFSLALAVMVQAVGAERRSLILGVGTAASSCGQILFSPLSMTLIQSAGWESALVYLALISLMLLPLAWLLPGQPPQSGTLAVAEQSLREALSEALAHRGYVLLTFGFFVCGFHVAFITVHFPAYVRDLGLDPAVGAISLALIGLFNIAGSLGAGVVGQRFSKRLSLSGIYALRAVAITALVLAPKTPEVIYTFAAVMGVLWLSTVPLTTGIVAQVFGVRYMSTLFGIVFLSHQVGSFLGVWLGGKLYDATGNYDLMWYAGIVLGVVAAIVHVPINERPVARLGTVAA